MRSLLECIFECEWVLSTENSIALTNRIKKCYQWLLSWNQLMLMMVILTGDSGVEENGDDWWALHEVHTVVSQPVEGLEEQQHREQSHKLGREVIPEHSEGQAGLGDGVEGPLNQMLRDSRCTWLQHWIICTYSPLHHPPRVKDSCLHVYFYKLFLPRSFLWHQF